MAVEFRYSDLDDPFAGYSVLSLLPRTLGTVPHADAPTSEAQEHDSIRTVLSSLALKGSAIAQAQEINKTCQNTLGSSKNRDELAPRDALDRPQGRRPALGRKRARFSLNPVSGDSVPNLDLSSQIDHIDDPEEYFLTFEQLENADKELKKLRGEVSPDPLQHLQPAKARRHRPSILGKTVSYKHHFPTIADTAEAFIVSQEEISVRSTDSPSKSLAIPMSSNILPPNKVDAEPVTSQVNQADGEILETTEKEGLVEDRGNINSLLEKLLSSYKDLDESQGAALLRESLQIKSIDVAKINLPELHTLQRNDFRPLDNWATCSKSDRCQILQALSTQARSTTCFRDSYGSKNQEKHSLSPPASMSCHDKNSLASADASRSMLVNGKISSLVDKLQVSFFETDKPSDASSETKDDATEHSHCSPRNTTVHRYNHSDDDINDSDRLGSHMEEQGNDMQEGETITEHPDPVLEDPHSSCAGYSGTENVVGMHCDNEAEDHSNFGVEVHASSHLVDGTLHNEVIIMAQDEPTVGMESYKDLLRDGQSAETSMRPAENNETQECQVTSTLSQCKEKKQKTRNGQSKQKLISKRQSLAGAGMMCKSGVKRSTRIKSRPLQYWRGERFIYGRIHDSLATVIGLKIESPGKNGKEPMLKVKSFVSKKYADLVAHAGQY